MIVIEPATAKHVSALGFCMRPGDKAEIEAAGLRPGKALWRSWRASIYSRVALVDGEVAAIWGLGGSALGKIGEPWLLTAPPVETAKVAFVREGRKEVAKMLTICPVLTGYVDASYHQAVRLLEMLGFETEKPLPFGRNGALFRRYRMERPG